MNQATQQQHTQKELVKKNKPLKIQHALKSADE